MIASPLSQSGSNPEQGLVPRQNRNHARIDPQPHNRGAVAEAAATFPGCCAIAEGTNVTGHATAEPPSRVMNSRRIIRASSIGGMATPTALAVISVYDEIELGRLKRIPSHR